ncbi:MAG TPA: glycosyltransferase family 4 protein [Prolixibacteraceae bacterium]|nr:glycosyltransferase family 4 protein [Prolixibacteraceae bacterium]
MKVLWIINNLFPDICNELGIETPVGGGWIFSSAKTFLNLYPSIQLGVASPYNVEKQKTHVINGITYFLVPNSKQKDKYNQNLETQWKHIQHNFKPDLVHIHGTEYPHGLAYINACGINNVVASIQGLVSVYARYYLGGINENIFKSNITLRDIYKQDTILSQQRQFMFRGELEKSLIQSVHHIIGRTSWDKAHIWAINPTSNYHFCNETLRDEFYQMRWNLNSCEKYSIFLSQAHYPIKGLHQMIKALPLILDHYPNTKIYVAGNNFVTNKGWRLNGFGKYIQQLMKEKGISNKIVFTGILSEEEMCNRYLSSHVFVCPSAIENSCNSIGEAQLLGVPCVASYVGGTSDLIRDEESGLLYRFEEVEMLAAAICRIFSNDLLAENLSTQGKAVAHIRHNKLTNANTLYSIYQSICKSS